MTMAKRFSDSIVKQPDARSCKHASAAFARCYGVPSRPCSLSGLGLPVSSCTSLEQENVRNAGAKDRARGTRMFVTHGQIHAPTRRHTAVVQSVARRN